MASQISLEEARRIAEGAVIGLLSDSVDETPDQWLSAETLEAPNCWLFLPHGDVKIREGTFLRAGWAFVVSKKTGKISKVADHSRDLDKLRLYVSEVSENLGRGGE